MTLNRQFIHRNMFFDGLKQSSKIKHGFKTLDQQMKIQKIRCALTSCDETHINQDI